MRLDLRQLFPEQVLRRDQEPDGRDRLGGQEQRRGRVKVGQKSRKFPAAVASESPNLDGAASDHHPDFLPRRPEEAGRFPGREVQAEVADVRREQARVRHR